MKTTSRQRVLAAINHMQPDRVPFNISIAQELERQICDYLNLSMKDFHKWLGNDTACISPIFHKSVSEYCYADPTIEVTANGHYLDIYRVPFRRTVTHFQTYMELAGQPPLADMKTEDEIEKFPWPTADMWDYSNISTDILENRDKALWGHSRGFFEIAHFMRGMENFLMDLALNPDFACLVMDKIFVYLFDRTKKILETAHGELDFFEYNDDVASQTDLFVSPEMWCQFVKPRMAKICDLIHSFGAKVRYHSCGSVYRIIPELIEIGVDILNPVQALAKNMNPFQLKKEFGSQLTFDGGVDIQRLLPCGNVEEVRAEVGKLVEEIGAGGGYIFGGSHCLQGDIPVENVVAMVEQARKC